MAGELSHLSVGTDLSQSEWEAVGAHVLNLQAVGDMIYATSATQLSRLAIGGTNAVLRVSGGVPGWATTLAGLTLTSATLTSPVINTQLTGTAVGTGASQVSAGNHTHTADAPTTADYLVGTAQAGLSAEIVVGATPGGELGGTWAAPTVDPTHSGSAHHAQLHATAHQPGGGDAMTVDAAAATGSLRTLGTGAAQAATGNHTHSDIRVRAYNSAAISIPNNTETALTFDSERWDTDTMHSTVSNTGRLTATTAGQYVISANIGFAANATGYRYCTIRLNGVTPIASHAAVGFSNDTNYFNLSTTYNLAATDYVDIVVFQNSGAALNVTSAPNASPEFGMLLA